MKIHAQNIKYSFDDDLSEYIINLDFELNIPVESIKQKTKIIEVKKSKKSKKDASTRLF